MKLLNKRLMVRHAPGRAPLCGFVTYIHPTEPVLLRRQGWEVSDDVHDDHEDLISRDNGRTWGEPQLAIRSRKIDGGGYVTFTENAMLYLPKRDRLVKLIDMSVSEAMQQDFSAAARLHITVEPPGGPPAEPLISDFGMRQGLFVSFCFPIEDSRGRVLAPVQWQKIDADGSIRRQGFAGRRDQPDVMADVWEVGLLIGEFDSDDRIHWRVSEAVPYRLETTSRGLCEPTIVELRNGRLAMVIRGSNAAWPDRPGYKWLSFSDDGGQSWSETQPWPCDDGSVLESSATGSALFRSIKNDKLYWIGNLCLSGPRPSGNWPRSPLYIARVQEEPFALIRSSITVIDQHSAEESDHVQLSNFRYYQDRATGDVVLYMTRYGEHGADGMQWLNADEHEYRVAID